jgi:hypothetical protein
MSEKKAVAVEMRIPEGDGRGRIQVEEMNKYDYIEGLSLIPMQLNC